MSAVRFELEHAEAAYVAALLQRIVGWEPRSAVRVRTTATSAGFLVAPPLGALAFVAVPVAAPGEAVDRTVSAGRLRDVIGDVSVPARHVVALPDEVGPVAELAVLPPSGPWIPGARGTAGDVAPLVDAGIADFRRRSAADPAAAQAIAEELWSAPAWGGLPLRVLHAARLLGLLAHDPLRIESGTCEGWKRLLTPGGLVFLHAGGAPPVLSLAVLR